MNTRQFWKEKQVSELKTSIEQPSDLPMLPGLKYPYTTDNKDKQERPNNPMLKLIIPKDTMTDTTLIMLHSFFVCFLCKSKIANENYWRIGLG